MKKYGIAMIGLWMAVTAQAATFYKVEYHPDGSGVVRRIANDPVMYLDKNNVIQSLKAESIISTSFGAQDQVRLEHQQIYINNQVW